ncbi:Eukaryotic translation initiation factor 3 subunit F [Rhodotorula toruloides ATCC 204091]|uniref:Eukaryotic translation initiation factor 3 subunit F n=1 Tax=Rhodotorula toruloides TaxID=5286 RepID=A0A0K3CRR7_RHOTO|nr:Eukaryotic translation initiation factor 3 subunit F [Rhodotorula toruloides ATCC 204091]KAK4333130.1 Eukaryotic translation initiation factor 3 subunit F [Rhodotorula toruloides]PRQ70018.1 eukaryotic translation initiation factor 3 subunit F [Rhodotorula toruloides]
MSSLTLALPASSLPTAHRPVQRVHAHPAVLASVLDAHLRRNTQQDRVFGTLLGVRDVQSGTVELRNAFGVPYEVRGKGQVTIDMDHHRAMLDLHLKVNPREVVVGWYATSPQLNSFSALIHNFYTSESAPHPAIHLTLDPSSLSFAAYTASPLGLRAQDAHLAFTPVSTSLRVPEQERPGLDLLTSNLSSLSALAPAPANPETPQTPLQTLQTLLATVSQMLDQVLAYVADVVSGAREGDEKVGRALYETVGHVPRRAPAAVAATEDDEEKAAGQKDKKTGAAAARRDFEEEFNAHLADVLMVSYLANVIKTQAELSSRLNLVI